MKTPNKLDSARKAQALRRLRRDILSSQVQVILDEKERKQTPHEIELLATLNLPLSAEVKEIKRSDAPRAMHAGG